MRRGQRILDAAGELILRWGSKRVTVDEVAKRAGVGKGTVYLHFESRVWLFMCVLMRESVGPVDDLLTAIRYDPTSASMAEQTRITYLAVQRRPLLRAMVGRDSELLGELAHEEAIEPLRGWAGELARALMRLLREHGLMRTDLDIDEQGYLIDAIQAGFHLHPPGTEPEVAANVLAYAVRAVVEPPGVPDPDALARVAPTVIESYERFRATLVAAIGTRPARQPRTDPG